MIYTRMIAYEVIVAWSNAHRASTLIGYLSGSTTIGHRHQYGNGNGSCKLISQPIMTTKIGYLSGSTAIGHWHQYGNGNGSCKLISQPIMTTKYRRQDQGVHDVFTISSRQIEECTLYLPITISSRQIEEAIIFFSESISFLPAKILCDVPT